MDLLVKTFYKADSETYEYKKTLNLSSRDKYFLQMLLMCLTAKESFLFGSSDKTLFDEFNKVEKRAVLKPIKNSAVLDEKRGELDCVPTSKSNLDEKNEKKVCKRVVEAKDDQVLPSPKRRPNILKKKLNLKIDGDEVKPTIANPIKKRVVKK